MTISPLDVRNQVFKRRVRGFDVDEVRMFLDVVADRMEEMLREKETLEKDNTILGEKADCFTDLESSLRETMVTAQRISDEAKMHAQKEADSIIREAEIEAKRRISDAMSRMHDLERSRESARNEASVFVAKVKSLLESQLRFLGDIESEIRSETGQESPPAQEGVEVCEDVSS
ncbi:MAG: DivIVA domain-containing protein [Candidatus Eisenbacteria bacterium]